MSANTNQQSREEEANNFENFLRGHDGPELAKHDIKIAREGNSISLRVGIFDLLTVSLGRRDSDVYRLTDGFLVLDHDPKPFVDLTVASQAQREFLAAIPRVIEEFKRRSDELNALGVL